MTTSDDESIRGSTSSLLGSPQRNTSDALSNGDAQNGSAPKRWRFPSQINFEIEAAQIEIPDEPSLKFSFRKLWAFTGPGFLMCIAYLDPGNIESDLQQGAIAQYNLLWVLFWATFLGFCLQAMSARLGAVTGKNLAEHCYDEFSIVPRTILWLMIELAIIGSDIQEVIGSAFAINLLSEGHIPIWAGVLITGFDTFTFLFMEMYNLRNLEALFGFLVSVMAISFWYFYFTVLPDTGEVFRGIFVPGCRNCTSEAGQQALGIVGAVIMPHNLYLHSALVLSRNINRQNLIAIKEANMYYAIESGIALFISFIINLAVVSVFAAVFYPDFDASLADAGGMIYSHYGKGMAAVWGIGILASGQSSTMTGTYAGQFVMEGFLQIRWARWKRVLLTRSIAMVPTVCIALFALDDLDEVSSWLNVLQSVLLPFAIVPTLLFTSRTDIMTTTFVNPMVVRVVFGLIAVGIVFINYLLIYISLSAINLSTTAIVFIGILGVVYMGFVLYISFYEMLKTKFGVGHRQIVNVSDPLTVNTTGSYQDED